MQPTRTFHADRGVGIILLLGSFMLFGLGFGMVARFPLLGVPTLLFGGILFVLGAGAVVPGAAYLRLDSEGFELKSFRSRRKTKWQDVKGFRLASFDERLIWGKSRGEVIGIEYHPTYTRDKKARAVTKVVAGFEDFIPNAYNIRLRALEKELGLWLARYGKPGR